MPTVLGSETLRSQKAWWHDGSLGYSRLIARLCIGLANTIAMQMGCHIVLHDLANVIPAWSVLPCYSR